MVDQQRVRADLLRGILAGRKVLLDTLALLDEDRLETLTNRELQDTFTQAVDASDVYFEALDKGAYK